MAFTSWKWTQAALAMVFALIPILGALMAGWDVRQIIWLYWLENLIIGFWNAVRMLTATPRGSFVHNLFPTAFFLVHYGIFCGVHGLFITQFTQGMSPGEVLPSGSGHAGFDFFHRLFGETFATAFHDLQQGALWALAVTFVRHGVELVRVQFLEGERHERSAQQFMGRPYKKIVVLHLAIIAAGFLSKMMGQVGLALLITVVVGHLILELREIFMTNHASVE